MKCPAFFCWILFLCFGASVALCLSDLLGYRRKKVCQGLGQSEGRKTDNPCAAFRTLVPSGSDSRFVTFISDKIKAC
jgi:hypothetical protein